MTKVNSTVERAKGVIGGVLIVLVGVGGVLSTIWFFARGVPWVQEHVYPPVMWLTARVLAFAVPLCLLLLAPRKTRAVGAIGLFSSTYILGFSLWLFSLLLLGRLASTIWVIFGLLFFGVGVIPLAVVTAALEGYWRAAGEIVLAALVLLGFRTLSLFAASKAERPLPEDSGAQDRDLGGPEAAHDPQRLFAAMLNRDLEGTTRLIQSCPRLANARNNVGATPLYIAARIPWPTVVELLLAQGADANAAITTQGEGFSAGDTPLVAAIQSGSVESLRLLIGHGAALDSRNAWKYSPLTVAMEYGRREAFEVLLQAGADPNLDLGDGWRALHAAAIHDSREAAPYFTKLLLAHGADPKARTLARLMTPDEKAFAGQSRGERTPLDYAKPGTAVQKLLLEASKGSSP